MRPIHRIVVLTTGLAALAACATTPLPEATVESANAIKGSLNSTTDNAQAIASLNDLLATSEEQIGETINKPQLNLAWTFAAMTTAEALSNVPGLSDEAYVAASGKTLAYSDAASETCLNYETSGVDTRQGNFCGTALAVRRLSDSSSAVKAFELAAIGRDWDAAKEAAASFGAQVSESWVKYSEEAAQLALADQNATPFKRMALQQACGLQSAQGGANLLGNPSDETDVRSAKLAYWTAMAKAAAFVGVTSSADICTSEPDGLGCEVQTEIAVAETCRALN